MDSTEQAVTDYLTHIDSHDVEAALSCLADTFELEFPGTGYSMTKEDARSALEWDAGTGGKLNWRIVDRAGRQLTIQGHETNQFLELIGIGELAFRSTFEVTEAGRIGRQIHEIDWGPTTLGQAMEPLLAWASENAPDDLAEIYPDGRMIYTRPMAERWVALARRWQSAIDP